MHKVFALVAILILAGCAAQPGPVIPPATSLQPQAVDWSAAQSVEVDLEEFNFGPDSLVFEAKRPYRITFSNAGNFAHNFTAAEFFSAVLLRPDGAGSAAAAAGQIELAPGSSTVVELVPITPGSYSFACTHGLHKAFGMSGEAVIR